MPIQLWRIFTFTVRIPFSTTPFYLVFDPPIMVFSCASHIYIYVFSFSHSWYKLSFFLLLTVSRLMSYPKSKIFLEYTAFEYLYLFLTQSVTSMCLTIGLGSLDKCWMFDLLDNHLDFSCISMFLWYLFYRLFCDARRFNYVHVILH